MEIKNKIRSEAMRLFNHLKKTITDNGQAMRQAWAVAKAETAMQTKIYKITFKKVCGEVTTRFATLCRDFFEYESKGSTKKRNALQIAFFDLSAQTIKSFTAANLLSLEVVT